MAMLVDTIERSITLSAPVERVWQALADHRQFSAWFGADMPHPFVPGAEATGIVTGCVTGQPMPMAIEIVAMEEPSLFSWRWHPFATDPDRDYSGEEKTLVVFRLATEGAGTRLTMTESGFAGVPAERRDEALRMNTGGWDQQMRNITAYVDG